MKRKSQKVSKESKKCIVAEVRQKKHGFINPVIVNFQNGDLNEKQASDFDVILSACEDGETNVKVKSPQGHIFKDSCVYKPQLKEFIAIRNRKTNKVKLIEVDSAVLINSVFLNSSTSISSVDHRKDTRTLHKTFAGKKISTREEQREKFNFSSLPIADDIRKDVESIDVNESFSLKATELESIIHLLPPCHRDATKLHDVYKITEILSEDELQSLKEKINDLDFEKLNPQEYSLFFISCYTQIKNSKDDLDTRLAGILFIECLIKFLKIPSKKLSLKSVFSSFSSVINEKLLNEFCIKTESSITRPMMMRDKILCYIIALALICCDFKVNLKILSLSTTVNLNRIIRLSRVVGVVPLTKEGAEFVLKVPLPPLPKSSKGRIQKK